MTSTQMDTKPLEKFAPWARVQLIRDVKQRMYALALDDEGRANYPIDADIVRDKVLSPTEKSQRAELFGRIQAEGANAFAEEMAYTWFNRFMAIRFMELHGFLPCGVRMLSSAFGASQPDCLKDASSLDLPGLDRDVLSQFLQAGDDEGRYRHILIAQCNQLAEFMPVVFGRVGGADALTLPGNLLGTGEDGVLHRLVTDIPESTWDDVTVFGWMYQFYNSELKDDFFKSKRKASAADIAPATQLFTPNWIVRYMVENSLGRLWMLNNPQSPLKDRMEYYIDPDKEHEEFLHIDGPEDITFCDPACGSGHILVYAFELIFAMYEERGYRPRDIPELILSKNLAGFEVDPRAAQIATLALTMCAREKDRRFFSRDTEARIRVFESIEFAEGELDENGALAQQRKGQLVEELAHLSEIGSLLNPSEEDLAAVRSGIAATTAPGVLSNNTLKRLSQAESALEALSAHFDVVVANPPYMGSSSFNPWMSKWIKKNYEDVKSDLCTCFIDRGFSLAKQGGYAAMVTMQSWMFLGSFEKMRNLLIDEKTIVTMAHLGPRAFDAIGGEVVSVTADVLYNGKAAVNGSYARLVDTIGSEPKRQKLLEAIQNPTCGWFYRADATTFHDIPGSPIAYWASDALKMAFRTGAPLGTTTHTHLGMATCDNERFLRLWWETSSSARATPDSWPYDFSVVAWVPYNKGGQFRKWSGNDEYVVNWINGGSLLADSGAVMVNETLRFKLMSSWTRVSSGSLAVRIKKPGYMFDMTGPAAFGSEDSLLYNTAFLNSSVGLEIARFLSASLDFQPGQIAQYPIILNPEKVDRVCSLVKALIRESQSDWDSHETSWGFTTNLLI